MKLEDFEKLTPRQQVTLLIAMHVRNEIEDFHAEHLSDAQMKQLNPLIRQAIYDALGLIHEPEGKEVQGRREQSVAWLVKMIPDYWEAPTKSSGSLPGAE